MTIKKFAKKWSISVSKAKKMLPCLHDVTYCECCKSANIPDDAVAIYIPDNRKYVKNPNIKKYCYLIDAISSNMILNEHFVNITEGELKTMVKHLAENGYILLKNGAKKESYNYRDYVISTKILEWKFFSSKQKSKIASQVLITIGKCADAFGEAMKTARIAMCPVANA